MKLIVNILLICLFILLASCDGDNRTNPVVDANHIKCFGFTLINTYWDDPTDEQTKTNYIDEVFEFSNIADLLVVDPADNIIDRMSEMNNFQVKSVLHLSEIFFEYAGTSSPSGAEYDLRDNFESRWDEFVRINNLQSNKGLIQAFYIGEEPTWNGITFEELKSAADYIKSTVPNVPIMIIEASPAIVQLQIPGSIDWIGFDHYFIKDPKTDTNYLSKLANLKSKFAHDDQKLVLVMDTHYIESVHGDFGGIALSEMADVANSYYELALSQPKTIAILGYFWPSGFDDPNSIGARNMPSHIKENYFRIGKEITGKE